MPGYHKKYQAGTGDAANPTRRDPAGLRPQQYSQSEMGQLESLKRQFAAAGGMETDQGKMIAARARAMQENIPLQEVYERYSDEFGEMGEKSLYPTPMRMVKKNQDGTGKADGKLNAGLKALFAERPDLREKFGYGKKEATRGLKTYQRGDGDMGGDSTMGATSQKPGPFSAGMAQITDQYNQHRMGVLNLLKPSDFKKLEEKGIDPQTADVYDILEGSGHGFGAGNPSLLERAARGSGLPLPRGNAMMIFKRVNEGRINPADFDAALAEKGYGSGPDGEQAGQLFTQALATGRLPMNSIVNASKTGPSGERKMYDFNMTDYLRVLPTGYEFLEKNKKAINRKGELKGDDPLAFNLKRAFQGKDIMTPKPTDMGEMEGLAQQEPELPKDIQGDIVEQRGLVDPMATLPTEVPTKRPDPKPVVEQRPDPVAEERIKPGPPPEADPIPPSDTPPGGPLGTFDLGMRIANPSDRLGGGGATGRFADATLGAELRRKGEAAARAAEQERANINRMGSALKAKLNALGRKYNKFTMGVGNPMDARPRGMRLMKRQ